MLVAEIIGSITLGVLPSIAWLTFFLYEDTDREPRKYIALTFMMGIAFAFVVLLVQYALQDIFSIAGIGLFSPLAIVLLAGTEEVGKFLAAFIAVRDNPDFDIPIDAMVYMVTAALGFALVENLGVVGGVTLQSASLADLMGTISFRFVGATLLHTLASSLVGYYWAKSIRAFGEKQLLILGIFIAVLLHAMFNYLILSYGAGIYSLALLLFAGFLVLGDFEELRGERV